MAIKDKTWALNQLRHKRNATIYTLAAVRLLNSPSILYLKDRLVMLRTDTFVFDPDEKERTGRRTEVRFNQAIEAYERDQENFIVDMKEFYKFARRNLLKESFEVLKAYASEQRIMAIAEAEPWYWFAYHVRNAVSHDLHWKFRGRARAKLPITWNGKTIDIAMEKSELAEWFIDPLTTFDLVVEMDTFIRNN